MANKEANKYEEPYLVPYPITQVWTNGNFTIFRGAVQERKTLDRLNLSQIIIKYKCSSQLHLWRQVQQVGIPITDLEHNIEYRLGLMISNGNRNHSSQAMGI